MGDVATPTRSTTTPCPPCRSLEPTACSCTTSSASPTPNASSPTSPTSGSRHLYLSPILQAATGSLHGYDVLDHTEIAARPRRPRVVREPRGRGEEPRPRHHRRRRAQPHGLRGPGVPEQRPLWELLRDGRDASTRGLVRHRLEVRRRPPRPARSSATTSSRSLDRGEIDTRPDGGPDHRPRRTGPALLRARPPRRRRHRGQPRPGHDGRPGRPRNPRPAALPPGQLARQGRHPQLPPVLRGRPADRRPRRGPRGLRGDPPAVSWS